MSNMIPATIDGTVLDVPNKEGSFILESSTFQSGTSRRDAGRHERHDLRRPGRRIRGRQAQAGHGADPQCRRARGQAVQGDARIHRAEGRDRPGHDQVHDPRRGARSTRSCSCARTTAPMPTSCSTSARTCWRSTKATCIIEDKKHLRRSRDRAADSSRSARSRPACPTASTSKWCRASRRKTRSSIADAAGGGIVAAI